MKMRWHVLGCLIALYIAEPLWAQAPGFNPSARPTFSPWLNLNRRGSNAAVNYYGIIRPQVNFSNSIQQLQQEVALPPTEATTAGSELPATGHVAGFLNHNKYFMNRGGVSASGATSAPTATAQRLPAQSAPARRTR
jgi:hypothetical protein